MFNFLEKVLCFFSKRYREYVEYKRYCNEVGDPRD